MWEDFGKTRRGNIRKLKHLRHIMGHYFIRCYAREGGEVLPGSPSKTKTSLVSLPVTAQTVTTTTNKKTSKLQKNKTTSCWHELRDRSLRKTSQGCSNETGFLFLCGWGLGCFRASQIVTGLFLGVAQPPITPEAPQTRKPKQQKTIKQYVICRLPKPDKHLS